MSTRRQFLVSAAATLAASSRLSAVGITTPPALEATLVVGSKHGFTIPRNFIGLSYESKQLANPAFFSAANQPLVDLFRQLSPNGVLRLGGSTSASSWWQPSQPIAQPEHSELKYPITAAAIVNLNQFLLATGWSSIYGLNLRHPSPDLAADEAAFVSKCLGPRLDYFQLGNEPDLFFRDADRKPIGTVESYFESWLAMARAVTSRVPGARFGAPDVAGHTDWISGFARLYAATPNPPRLAAITHHHYVGRTESPDSTIPLILGEAGSKSEWRSLADAATQAAGLCKVSCRLTEGNTCSHGGKPGVSDVFAAALWAADYCTRLAAYGYVGVNLHGGDGNALSSIKDGLTAGDHFLKDPTVPHVRPIYTPIGHIADATFATPVYYGMAYFQNLVGSTLLDSTLTSGNSASLPLVTVCAVRRTEGKTVASIINRDTDNDLIVHIAGMEPHRILRLTASAPDSTDVTLGGAHFVASRPFKPQMVSAIAATSIRVPKASAALIFSR